MFPRTQEVAGDPRRRETTVMLGPLAATIQHKPGAHYGYLAGREAYRDLIRQDPNFSAYLSLPQLRDLMDCYLSMPRYCPRWKLFDDAIIEWRAMFLLGWTERVLNEAL